MPTTITPKVGTVPKAGPLSLAGVGMRRKNLYITEVDVYMIGINFSQSGSALAKEWNAKHSGEGSLPAYIMKSCSEKIASDIPVSATLRFMRQVTKDQFLTAFDEAFKGCSPDAVADFRKVMGAAIESGVVKKGDELVLYWMNNGDIAFALNGAFGGHLTNRELNQRLLEVYIDPSRTVSKELYTSLENNIKNNLV
jgi:hypothetical protein